MATALQQKTSPDLEVGLRVLSPSQIDASLREQWEQLEDRAVEPNPFLSPHFVMPALKHLTPEMDVVFMVFETESEVGPELVGLGVFELSRGTKVVPFPHWAAYLTPSDTFLTNLLVDRECSRQVLTTFFEFIVTQRETSTCVEFTQRSVDSQFGRELVEVAAQFGMRWIGWQFNRPMLEPRWSTTEKVDSYLSHSRRKKLRAKKRRLEKMGQVTFEVARCGADTQDFAKRFLHLENMGWKGVARASLRSNPESEAFYREMTAGFGSANRMIFTELRLDDQVIGSTSNIAAGSAGFGFKIGWNPKVRQMSPGKLQAIELARTCHRELAELEYLDSGTDMNAFLTPLWPSKRKVTCGAFVSSHFSRLAVGGMLQLRLLKRKLKRNKRRSGKTEK